MSWPVCCGALVIALTAGSAAAAETTATGPGDATAAGEVGVDFRYRLEFVDDDRFATAAEASTLRLRLNLESADWHGLHAFAEFDYVAEIGLDDFDSGGGTSPHRSRYPVVADPHGDDLNQLWLEYAGLPGTRLRAGRQRIVLDNQRFVGGVGWRQNEQTFDGLALQYDGIVGVDIRYAWIARVNRIFGDRSPAGRNESNTHLLNATFALPGPWRITPYLYRIDDDDVPAFSTLTVGARLAASFEPGGRTLALVVDAATQTDAGNAPIAYRSDYLRIDASWSLTQRFTVAAGLERLGGDAARAGQAFRTPLATLHAFQGWADQFLSTPDAGIEDRFLSLTARPGSLDLQATWHDFSAADGNASWGRELDLSLGRRFGARYGMLVKGAWFDADGPGYRDVRKAWLMLTAEFR